MSKRFRDVAVLAAVALLPAAIHAATPTDSALHGRLIHEDGMTLISEGFYARSDGNNFAYVAIGKAGQQAYARTLRDLRPMIVKRLGANGIDKSDREMLADLDEQVRIAELPRAKIEDYGNCGNGAQVYARANSWGGTQAEGYAVLVLDFGPTTPTSNYAHVIFDGGTPTTSTGVAYTPASVNLTNASACTARARATVTCPGESTPAALASAFSFNQGPNCLQ